MAKLTKLREMALIARCVAGDDRQAFGLLVDAYAPDIRRLLLSLTGGDTALADDLAQEAFIKAYLNMRSFGGIARFGTWLYRIACNEYISHLRRMKPQVSLDSVLQENETDIPTEAELPYADITDTMLHAAVEKLPEGERMVTQLYYFEGFTIPRISSITGMPQGTVKSYLHRARAHLGKALRPML